MTLIFLCISFWQLYTGLEHSCTTLICYLSSVYSSPSLHLSYLFKFPESTKQYFFFFFLAALGLGCCKWAFSGCSEWASLAVVSLVAELSSRVLPSVVTAQDSVVVVYQLSCPAACGIFLDQGSNPCPLHWQADS